MSFVSTPEEGRELIRQLKVYDHLTVSPREFGLLDFTVDVTNLSVGDLHTFLDRVHGIDDNICLEVEAIRPGNGGIRRIIQFRYYITADLIVRFAQLTDSICNPVHGAILVNWHYE